MGITCTSMAYLQDLQISHTGACYALYLVQHRDCNCELSKAGQTVVKHGVIIIGETTLPGLLPHTASLLFANNLASFAPTLVSDGELALNLEDEILVGAPEGDGFHVPGMGGVLVAHEGVIHAAQSRLREAAG